MPKTNTQLQHDIKLLKMQVNSKEALSKNSSDGVTTNSGDLGSIRGVNSTYLSIFNGNRDLGEVYGYPETPSLDDYIGRFKRGDIAKRVIEAFPEACWGKKPKVTDDNDSQEQSVFEKAFEDLVGLKNVQLYRYIQRLDIIAGLGRYGLLFIGVNDNNKPNVPLQGSYTPSDIMYICPYSEKNASVIAYNEDPTDPRFGLPDMYQLKQGGYGGDTYGQITTQLNSTTVDVHHSRIIHTAEGLLENDVMGTPRLEAVYNKLIDLDKIIGGGAETFYLNSRGGLHINQDVNTQLTDPSLLEKRMGEYTDNLTRYLRTKGMDVNVLNFDIADPENYFNSVVSLISAATKIPKRILTGSEQGQLASTQDETNWLARVNERQTGYCESEILNPLIDWFILYGILPEPKDGTYAIEWDDLKTVSDIEKADVAVKKTQALSNYLGAIGADQVMPPEQLFTEVLDLEYREDDLPDADDRDVLSDIEPVAALDDEVI